MRTSLTLVFLCLSASGVDAGDNWPDCDPSSCPPACPDPPPPVPPVPMTTTGRRICLQSKNYLLDINSFRNKVEGKTYSYIYTIIESSEPTTLFLRARFRYHLSGNELQRDKTFRISPDTCFEKLDDDVGTLIFKRSRFAVNGERTNAASQTIPVRTFFISKAPEDHIILLTCDAANVSRKRSRNQIVCKGDYRVDILVSQDPPNRVNWYKIEKELRRALGVGLTDNRNYFLYVGEECAFD